MAVMGTPLPGLVGIGILLGAGAAWATGRAIADTWRPVWHVIPAVLLLTLTLRFLDYALFQGNLLSVTAALWALVGVSSIAFTSYRARLAGNMVKQYPWLYRRAGPFLWRNISD